MSDDNVAARERVCRVEEALETVEGMPALQQEQALDAIQALLELYGVALERIMKHLDREDSTVSPAVLAHDELIGHLLMVHGLHPLGFREAQEVPGTPGGPPLVQLEGGRAR